MSASDHTSSPPTSEPAEVSTMPPSGRTADSTTGAASKRQRGRHVPIVVLPIVLLIGGGVYFGLTQTEWGLSLLLGGRRRRPRRTRTFTPGNGFNLKNATIPKKEILGGGVPKDGIPAITQPRLIAGSKARYLKKSDRVIGVVINGQARAYPLRILIYHEAVNDRIGQIPYAVTYCPLCDSAAVFDRRGPVGEMKFGISGLLYNSNVLLYDRRKNQKESLWSQVMAQGISGPRAKQQLKTMPVELTTWNDWQARHPDSKVLSTRTGYRRDYSRTPYGRYFTTDELMFPVSKTDKRLQNKVPVLGVWTARAARAYPITEFQKPGAAREIDQQLDGRKFRLAYNRQAKSLRVVKADEGLSVMYAFWFAWYAFHPKTELYHSAAH